MVSAVSKCYSRVRAWLLPSGFRDSQGSVLWRCIPKELARIMQATLIGGNNPGDGDK